MKAEHLAGVFRRLRKPGWIRRLAVLILVATMVAGCTALISISGQGEVAVALEILLISVFGFSVVAAISYDAALCWRFVDFPWICASFAAIVAALLNIGEAARREEVTHARSEISRAFSGLIYATQSAVTNDCDDLPSRSNMWERAPEPYEGACDRMKHFLPQMTFSFNEFSQTQDVTQLTGWALNLIVPDTSPKGSWQGIYNSATQFKQVANRFGPILEEKSAPRPDNSWLGWLRSVMLTAKFKYWYFFLAFFVGLRLSKTTAEVLQVKAQRG